MKYLEARAMGTAAQFSEELAKPLDQSAVVVGSAAMQYYNSNQLEAVSKAAGKELVILRFPSMAGDANGTQDLVQGAAVVLGVRPEQESR